MTPWSASGQGHDPEEDEEDDCEEDGEGEAHDVPAPPPTAEEYYDALTLEERIMIREKWDKEGLLDPLELEEHLLHDAPDPLLLTIARFCRERDVRNRRECAWDERPPAGGAIQASQARSARMGSR
jgi:hypothetical protein